MISYTQVEELLFNFLEHKATESMLHILNSHRKTARHTTWEKLFMRDNTHLDQKSQLIGRKELLRLFSSLSTTMSSRDCLHLGRINNILFPELCRRWVAFIDSNVIGNTSYKYTDYSKFPLIKTK